jgi:hypothetical protein
MEQKARRERTTEEIEREKIRENDENEMAFLNKTFDYINSAGSANYSDLTQMLKDARLSFQDGPVKNFIVFFLKKRRDGLRD